MNLSVAAAIIAVTEAIKRVIPGVQGWITIIVAAALGLAAGIAGLEGLNWWTGLVSGLVASGGMTVAKTISSK